MKYCTYSLIMMLICAANLFAQTEKIESIYTDFGDKNCRELKDREADGLLYAGECRGVGGYKLTFYESEHHQSLDLIAPDGKTFDLNLIISVAPSFLGKVTEWRVRKTNEKIIPIAMIVRMNVQEEPNNYEKVKSFLLVTKITNDSACLVAKIPPIGLDQNEKARIIADNSADKPCVEKSN